MPADSISESGFPPHAAWYNVSKWRGILQESSASIRFPTRSTCNRHAENTGFALVELLVVIAIIAVLAVVVILTLNPSGLLQESRDANRISDMATLRSAISLYLADVVPVNTGSSSVCYVSENISTTIQVPISATQSTTVRTASTSCASWFVSSITSTFSNSRSSTGAGWIPINFAAISAGAPFATEPIDPTDNITFYYNYITNPAHTFKLGAQMESTKYAAGGLADIESTDGGLNVNVFETGSNLSL